MKLNVKSKRKKEKQMILKRLKVHTPVTEPTNCYIIKDEETN